MTQPHATPPESPSTRTKLFYGLGSVAFGVKDNGFATFLLLYYNQVLGLPEDWVGFGIMLALVADGVLDPLVGWLSDRLHSPWGRRHPFMYGSAIPVAIAYYFLWSPPSGLTQGELFAYFVAIAILVRLFIACYEIPSSSLAPELTDHYDERTSILSYRYFFGWWGGLTMAVLAYLVFLRPDAEHPVGVLNPVGYQTYGLVSAIIMVVAIVVSAAGTHARIPYLRQPPARSTHGLRANLAELRETLSNRSFLALFGVAIFTSLAVGIASALGIYFNTYFWELSSGQMSLLALLNFVSAAVAAGVAPRLSIAMGKKRAAIATAIGVLFLAPIAIVSRLLGVFPDNGSPALLPMLVVLNTIIITLFIIASILIAAMIADVVEDSEVTTGRRSEGTFFAMSAFVQKAVTGLGIFASTLLLRAINFPRGAKPGAVAPETVRALGLAYIPVVIGLFMVALFFLSRYRIDRDAHVENLRRLGRGGDATGGVAAIPAESDRDAS